MACPLAALSACSSGPTALRAPARHRHQAAGWRQGSWQQRRRPPPLRAGGLFGGMFGGGDGGKASASGSGLEEEDLRLQDDGFDDEGEDEGASMVRLDAESYGSLDGSSQAPLGPLAVLAVGFTQQEFERLRKLLHEDMEAEMVKVVPAPAAALAGTLGAALELDPVPQFEQAALGTRRVCFLSGMYAAEVMETIAAFKEAGLPETVFAAAVPNNYDRPLKELVQEVFADHQAMKRQAQQAAAERLQQQQQAGETRDGRPRGCLH